MPAEQVATFDSVELSRKYLYLVGELTQTWYDNNFLLSWIQRSTGRWSGMGRQAIIPLETAPMGSFAFSGLNGGPPEAGTALFDEAFVDFTTFATSVEFDLHAKEAGETNQQSFINLKLKLVADAVEMMGYRWSHALFVAKNQAMARVKTVIGGGVVQLYTEGESGANGTYGARYLFPNGYASASANLTGTAAEVNFDGFTQSVDRINDRATLTGVGVANVIADSYLFWGSKIKTSKGAGVTGLPELVDDGQDFAVFEGRDRTAAGNEDWQSGVDRAFGFGNIEREIMKQMRNLDKRRGAVTDVVLYSLEAQQLHFDQMKVDRRALVPVNGGEFGPTFQGGFKALPIAYGDRNIAAMANRENPGSFMYGLNWAGLNLSMLRDPKWIDEGEGMWKYVMETYRWRATLTGIGQLASKDPGLHWKTTGMLVA